MKNKTRILLFVLSLLFFATAVTVNKSISNNDLLELDSKKLSNRLHHKEELINKIFDDEFLKKTFINSERYPLQVREIANEYQKDQIYLYLYKDSKPIFWSSNVYVPDTEAGLKENSSIINADNYTFFVKKKNLSKNINIIALIPIQRQFKTNYKSLGSQDFVSEMKGMQLSIAKFGDEGNIKNIYAKDRTFLFSVKLNDTKYSNIYLSIQLICWGLGTLCAVILITIICIQLAKSNKAVLSIFLLITTLCAIRMIDLETNWLSQISNYRLFSPRVYAYNYLFPNLWSFLVNSIMLLWLVTYLLYIKNYIHIPVLSINKRVRNWIFYGILLLSYFFYNEIFNQLSTLITHSSFSKDEMITLFFSHDFTLYHILIYTINIISIVLIADAVIFLGKIFVPKIITNLNIQLIALVSILIFNGFYQDFSMINILIAILIMLRSFDKSMLKDNSIYTNIITIITLAIISTLTYSDGITSNTRELMKMTLLNLESDDDIEAISLFSSLEKNIENDIQLQKLIALAGENPNTSIIDNYIHKTHLAGYLANYNLTAYYYYNGIPINTQSNNQVERYREKVISNSIKINHTKSFYKLKTEIGHYDYFALINTYDNSNIPVSIILNLKKNLNNVTSTIPFLNGSSSNQANGNLRLKDFNFAIYKNGLLISQNGKFTYPNSDPYSKLPTDEFIDIEDSENHYHVILRPNNNTTLVVSNPTQSYWQFITVVSITFLYLYFSLSIINLVLQILPQYISRQFTLRGLVRDLRFIISRIRYSTRIQTLVISSVMIAIVISGIISFYSIKIQTERNRRDQKLEYIANVIQNLEQISFTETDKQNINEVLYDKLSNLTDVLVTDFNLYDRNGKLFFTTQPGIYNHNLISSYINSHAYLDINVLKKNETIKKEQIIDFDYESTYAAIKDSNYKTIAFLGIPYFNYQQVENDNINILLKTILNIYTIIIIIFAFLSVYISNKITEPLQIIRKKLSQTDISDKPNESLFWEKDDEIGLLVKEYNYMLIKLEENAKHLRNAERESVWREMAQQVAHEIKNPLTPMKLGIQQLNRAFKDNDERFPERFEKISLSFIEQIETLARIASEFSAFAKLPETQFVEVDLISKINKSINVYNNTPNIHIELVNKSGLAEPITIFGDRDQLIRTFNNLIKNSIEATIGRRKPSIQIILHRHDDEHIKIEIKDNGFGITDDVIPKIFKPNFTTKSSGTGLGLAFVKQTIQGMGGSIYFDTKLNHGTSFFIIIPLHLKNK